MAVPTHNLARRLRTLWSGKAVLALPGIVATMVLLLLHVVEFPVLRQMGNLLFDTYQRNSPRQYEAAPVKIVDIDDETIQRLGQWPWPRTDMARLTQLLTDAGASAIAFDIVFSEPDRTSPARVAAGSSHAARRGSFATIPRTSTGMPSDVSCGSSAPTTTRRVPAPASCSSSAGASAAGTAITTTSPSAADVVATVSVRTTSTP